MNISPYVFFPGTCRAAMTRYAEIFGTAPQLMTAEGMPPEFPVDDDKRDWIMHGMLEVNGGTLMASDNIFGGDAPMAGCAVQLNYPTAAEAQAIFDQLADGGETTMAFTATFWSAGFGTCTDKFGVRWMVGCDEQAG